MRWSTASAGIVMVMRRVVGLVSSTSTVLGGASVAVAMAGFGFEAKGSEYRERPPREEKGERGEVKENAPRGPGRVMGDRSSCDSATAEKHLRVGRQRPDV